MCKNVHYLIWEHTAKISHDESTNGVKCATKITPNQVQLNSFSFMNVKLEVQILSATTSSLLSTYYGQETTGTANFDCINIRSLKDGKIQTNIFCNSYEDGNDFRFNWLENSFLKLFEEWKQILSFVQKILPEMLSTACLLPIRHVTVSRLQYFPLLKIQNSHYNMAVLMY